MNGLNNQLELFDQLCRFVLRVPDENLKVIHFAFHELFHALDFGSLFRELKLPDRIPDLRSYSFVEVVDVHEFLVQIDPVGILLRFTIQDLLVELLRELGVIHLDFKIKLRI